MSKTVTLPGNVNLDGPRGRTYASILETVGSTPLVAAPKFAEAEGIKANLLFKCEFFNPLASVKDRIALNMVLRLEASGKLAPGGVLVEPTSGNTGFVPANADTSLIDEVVKVSNEESFETARKLARLEGIPGGISSGAAAAAAVKVGTRDEMAGKTLVVILPSFAERYVSTALFEGL